jgi:hypothetical protein
MNIAIHVKYPVLIIRFSCHWDLFERFSKNTQIQNFMNSVGAELLHAYRQPEGQTTNIQDMMKITATIHNSVNSLKFMSL